MLYMSLPLYLAVCIPPGANRKGLTCATAGQRSAMDRASSSVSGLRLRLARVALPMAAVLVTITVLGPKLRSRLVMAPSSPAMIEPTPITAPVPIITPSTVRNDLILCARIVSNARRAPDRIENGLISPPSRLRWDPTATQCAPGRCQRTGRLPPTREAHHHRRHPERHWARR